MKDQRSNIINRVFFTQVLRSPDHQRGGQVQALPCPQGLRLGQQRARPLHQRRQDNPVPRPPRQGDLNLFSTFLRSTLLCKVHNLAQNSISHDKWQLKSSEKFEMTPLIKELQFRIE